MATPSSAQQQPSAAPEVGSMDEAPAVSTKNIIALIIATLVFVVVLGVYQYLSITLERREQEHEFRYRQMVMTGTIRGKSFAKRVSSNVVAAAYWVWKISPFSPKDRSGSYTTSDRIASLLAEREEPKTPRFVPRVPFFARPNPSKRKPRLKPLTLSAEKREAEKHADLEKLLSPDFSDNEKSGELDVMLKSPDAFIDVNSDIEAEYTSPSLYSQRSPSTSSSRWSKDTTEMLVKPTGAFISPRTVFREARDDRERKVSLPPSRYRDDPDSPEDSLRAIYRETPEDRRRNVSLVSRTGGHQSNFRIDEENQVPGWYRDNPGSPYSDDTPTKPSRHKKLLSSNSSLGYIPISRSEPRPQTRHVSMFSAHARNRAIYTPHQFVVGDSSDGE
ncbi:hypothetical protein SCHPADRAFT_894131 [Schizopora paradoxa]|uniref:Uncharacterized protein n=1 Tax=Schizopora paradoxa TaxID=27342 RepID=A0A0H2RTI1_9AGAM|nr:hypothetical protein SCHPADRAFT_894131 [Schizopora paradoxa]